MSNPIDNRTADLKLKAVSSHLTSNQAMIVALFAALNGGGYVNGDTDPLVDDANYVALKAQINAIYSTLGLTGGIA